MQIIANGSKGERGSVGSGVVGLERSGWGGDVKQASAENAMVFTYNILMDNDYNETT